jgi:hypothetical protein
VVLEAVALVIIPAPVKQVFLQGGPEQVELVRVVVEVVRGATVLVTVAIQERVEMVVADPAGLIRAVQQMFL